MFKQLSTDASAVSLSEAKAWLRLPAACSADEEDMLEMLSITATNAVEKLLNRKLTAADFEGRFTAWPHFPFRLHMSPLNSVSAVKYIDTGGAEQTLSASDYRVVTFTEPGYITVPDESLLPKLSETDPQPVRIEYNAGYTTVPEKYKQFVLMGIASGYMQRASISAKNLSTEALIGYIMQQLRNERIIRF